MIAIIFAYKDSKIRSSEVYLGLKLHSTQWDFAPLARFFAGRQGEFVKYENLSQLIRIICFIQIWLRLEFCLGGGQMVISLSLSLPGLALLN